MCNINKEGKLQNINISIDICELCIERNPFKVSSYIYKCSLKRPINGSTENFTRGMKKWVQRSAKRFVRNLVKSSKRLNMADRRRA